MKCKLCGADVTPLLQIALTGDGKRGFAARCPECNCGTNAGLAPDVRAMFERGEVVSAEEFERRQYNLMPDGLKLCFGDYIPLMEPLTAKRLGEFLVEMGECIKLMSDDYHTAGEVVEAWIIRKSKEELMPNRYRPVTGEKIPEDEYQRAAAKVPEYGTIGVKFAVRKGGAV